MEFTSERYPELRVRLKSGKYVRFVKGELETTDQSAIAALDALPESRGVKAVGDVTGSNKPLQKWSVAELKDYAEESGIDLGGATKKADVLAAVLAAEADDSKEGDEPNLDES